MSLTAQFRAKALWNKIKLYGAGIFTLYHVQSPRQASLMSFDPSEPLREEAGYCVHCAEADAGAQVE